MAIFLEPGNLFCLGKDYILKETLCLNWEKLTYTVLFLFVLLENFSKHQFLVSLLLIEFDCFTIVFIVLSKHIYQIHV